LELVLDVY